MSEADLQTRIAVLERRAERERQARKQAENLLEQKSLELYAAKVEAETASRMKSEFLANMSHELRTPLNCIIGFAEIIEGEILGPIGTPGYRTYAGDIRESGRHLLTLINDILDLAKIEAGHLTLNEDAVDVAAVLKACIRMVSLRAECAGVDLVISVPHDLGALQADEKHLRQILLNLLTNAVKFTPSGGRVVVSTALDEDGGLVVTIADTGVGIAEADLPRIMEPFVQADGGLARKQEGTGLGLPLSKRLVELHGGTLRLESTPGNGTTVIALFPASRVLRPIAA